MITLFSISIKAQETEVGTLPGTVGVSPSGAATYTIPIDLPPGRAGMEPTLALSYNSQAGNGLLGMGWAITGLSSISRAGTSIYLDGYVDGVDFDNNDRFVLDGNMLIPVNPEKTEFRTEQETYSKIVAMEGTAENPGWFEVFTKDGLILEFGSSEDSRIEGEDDGVKRDEALSYLINKISDRQGNYIEYMYIEEKGFGKISEIKYTLHAGLISAAPNIIKFKYQGDTRDDVIEQYLAGCTITIDKLLDTIEVNYGTENQRIYQLVYQHDLYAHLIDINLSTIDNGALNPTIFTRGIPTQKFDFQGITDLPHNQNEEAEYTFGDFNGDGKTDIIAAYYNTSQSGVNEFNRIVTYYSIDGISYQAVEDFQLNKHKNTLWYFIPGDFNGDGLTDVAMFGPIWYKLFISEGEVFNEPFNKQYNHASQHYFRNIDINGNGIDDLLLVHYNDPYDTIIGYVDGTPILLTRYKMHINAIEHDFITNPGSVSTNLLLEGHGVDGYEYRHDEINLLDIYPGDYNGDGKTDLIINRDNQKSDIMIYDKASKKIIALNPVKLDFPNNDYNQIRPGDYNGDGITDLLAATGSAGIWKLRLYNGFDKWITVDCPITRPEGYMDTTENCIIDFYNFKTMTSDFNGDGKTDILHFYEEYCDPGHGEDLVFNQSHFIAYYTNGLSFTKDSIATTSHNVMLERPYPFNDFDGDGKNDCFIDDKTENDYCRALFLHKDEQTQLVQSITNGMGIKTDIVYKPLTDNEIYTKGTGATFPVIDLQFPWYVTVQTSTENMPGNDHLMSYTYESLKLHKQGKGLLGFGKLHTINHTSNITSTSTFDIFEADRLYYHPYLAENETKMWSSGDLLSYTINTLEVKPNTLNNKIYTSVVSESQNSTYDAGNIFIRRSKTVQDLNFIDLYGNSKKQTVYVDGDPSGDYEYETITEAEFEGFIDAPNWLISRPEYIKVTRKKENESDDIMQTDFDTYYPGTTLVKDKRVTPNGNSFLKLVFNYEYDSYGNLTKQTQSAPEFRFNGQSIQNRVTNFDYSTDNNYNARFLTGTDQTVNGTTYKTTFNYDPVKGRLDYTTSYDNLVTEYNYDAFNRPQVTEYADGTSSHNILYWNNGHEHAPAHVRASYYQYTFVRGEGNPFSQMKQFRFYDKLGRLLRHVKFGLLNEPVYTDYYYQIENGLLWKVSEPYIGWQTPSLFTEYEYDDLNRPFLTRLENGNAMYTFRHGRTVIKLNEGLQQETIKTVNALGHTQSITDPTGIIDYDYYASGNVKQIDALGAITTMFYDDAGRQDTLIEPNSGLTAYIYNPYGELMQQTDAGQNQYQLLYDEMGRITDKILTNTGEVTRYLYNDVPLVQGATGDGFGKLEQLIGANGFEYRYWYDEYNRLEEQHEIHPDQISGQVVYNAYFTYEGDMGRIDTYTYPSGFTIDYDYADNGMLWRVKEAEPGVRVLWQNDEVNARGQITDYTLGNGLTTQKTFDAFGFPASIVTGNTQNLGYTFDPISGNLTQRKDNFYNLTENFGYDTKLKSRLTSWQVEGQQQYVLSYLSNGNIIFKSDVTSFNKSNIGDKSIEGEYMYGDNAGPHAVTGILNPTDEYQNIVSAP